MRYIILAFALAAILSATGCMKSLYGQPSYGPLYSVPFQSTYTPVPPLQTQPLYVPRQSIICHTYGRDTVCS